MIHFSIPLICSAIAFVIGLLFSGPMETAIKGEGVTGPEALVILAPTLQLIGALSLLFSQGSITKKDADKINELAKEARRKVFKGTNLTDESKIAETRNIKEELSVVIGNKMAVIERRISLIVLSAGFALQLGLEFIKTDIPVKWFTLFMLVVAVMLALITFFGWPNWKRNARNDAKDALISNRRK